MDKSPDAFRTISEVAEDLAVPQHVLRFWETRFAHIRPLKRGGGRRYYRPDDVELLKGIRQLLYGQGYTIRGVQKILKKDGIRFVQSIGRGEQAAAAPEPGERGDSYREAENLVPAADPPPDEDPVAGGYSAAAGLSDDDIDLLQAVLADLAECERVLRALRTGPEPGATN